MTVLDQIRKFPNMILESMQSSKNIRLPLYSFENVVICGAGGSAVVGDLLKDILKYELRKPIEVSTEYRLPAFVDNKTLAIVISYSGNTEETLSQFMELRKVTNKIISISSGGKLETWSKRFRIPHIKVPSGFQPRLATPYMLVPLIAYFGKIMGKDFDGDVYEGYREIRSLEMRYVEKLAARIQGKELAVYASNEYAGVVKAWKNCLNENSKLPVMWHVLPEMNHNEIVGYQNPDLNKNRVVIFFRDRDESPEIRARIDASEKLMQPNVFGTEEVWAKGVSKISKLLVLVFAGLFLSAMLAELQGIDAERIESIDSLKYELGQRISTISKLEQNLN